MFCDTTVNCLESILGEEINFLIDMFVNAVSEFIPVSLCPVRVVIKQLCWEYNLFCKVVPWCWAIDDISPHSCCHDPGFEPVYCRRMWVSLELL